MTPDERQLLAGLFDRIRNASGGQRDAEAEAFIADGVRQQPYAPYLLAQSVIVQDETLKAAAAKIEELEARLREQEGAHKPGSFLGGIGKSILQSQQQAPQQQAQPAPDNRWTHGGEPVAPPQQQGGASWPPQAGVPMQQPMQQSMQQPMQQPGGGGFLKGALGAAAGVAGGMLLANSLSGLFGAHNPLGGSPAKAADLPKDSLPKDDNLSLNDSARWNENDRKVAASDSRGDSDKSSNNDQSSGSNDWGNDDDGDDDDSGSDDWGGGDDTTDI
ncbi:MULTISPECIES: DUF2076 domain-containing protein [unclassified Beijerinckia]|uniref:DUF2076 domain-containing protein n=1 Tax=unclassified Beijerinckia TaxID=2638183 RepID=UPI00089BD8E4|nr:MULTISPECIES: DUF2076 domain-containing protein [unclassified Beijerinckia]MDH7796574.1 hypothetical protein [Beijerinckia sp. GAS462]SEC50911.1 hypothetical protein SAMN05443249_2858 [Beijerinckia sp. 28-YEA-48]